MRRLTLTVGYIGRRLNGDVQRVENDGLGFRTYVHVNRLAAGKGEIAELRSNGHMVVTWHHVGRQAREFNGFLVSHRLLIKCTCLI